MFKTFQKILPIAILLLLFAFAVPAMAGSLAILDDLNAQNASVSILDNNSLDQARAKATFFVTMSRPGYADLDGGQFYQFYNSAYQLIHTAYYSAGTRVRQGSTANPTLEEYFVDPMTTPGSYNQTSLLRIDRSTGAVTILNTERVMYMNFNGIGALGRFTKIPGWGAVGNLPMSASTTSPTRIILR